MNVMESSLHEVVQAMIDRLKSRRDLDPDGEILSARDLAEQAASQASDQALAETLASKEFQQQAVAVDINDPDTPVALKEDLERLASSDALLDYLKRRATPKKGQPYSLASLKKSISPGDTKLKTLLGKAFEQSVERRTKAGEGLEVKLPAKRAKKDDEKAALSENLLKVLKSQRPLGEQSYPLTLRKVAELAEVDTARNKKQILNAITIGAFGKEAIAARNDLDAPASLREDVERLVQSEKTFLFALRNVRTDANRLKTIADIAKPLTSSLSFKTTFQRIWSQRAKDGKLPPGVAGVGGQYIKVFLVEDLLPGPVRDHLMGQAPSQPAASQPVTALPAYVSAGVGQPARDGNGNSQKPPASDTSRLETFTIEFSAAFSRLDNQRGGYNLVSLAELRGSLPGFSREQFDASLRELRKQGLYSLSEGQSKHGIPQHERDAGIWEAGNLLIYASRRTS